jgi:exopolysaccharide biosynthesis polyprenyl glycosylphosphotransferase
MNLRRAGSPAGPYPLSAERVLGWERRILDEDTFQRTISLERKRSERSRKPFLLMLLDTGSSAASEKNSGVLQNIVTALLVSTRETDVTGWYKERSVIGVMFTELVMEEKRSILGTIFSRLSNTLKDNLTFEQFNQISISFHVFPDEWDHDFPNSPGNPTLYPDLMKRDDARKFNSAIKRVMDLVGSVLALIINSPLFVAVALAIKLTSRGPVFFKQQRVGQHGKPFTLLKFRSMYVGNDSAVHKAYVKQLIAGNAEAHAANGNGNGQGVYKLTSDARITPVGAFLRRSSLDEMPQFLNVLRGEMSLVGPRPPVPYEVENYDIWHRRRLLEAKPGITGLWQVTGRSRVKFDDMVRLDLRYAKTWSPWLDIKILMRTPLAVLFGDGAY